MKRLFVTLACLAVLVFYGAYAYNQHQFKTGDNSSDTVVTQTPYQSGQIIDDTPDLLVSPTPFENNNSTSIAPKITKTPTQTPTKAPASTNSPVQGDRASTNSTSAPTKTPSNPTMKPAAKSESATSTTSSSFANEVLRLINQQRSKAGLSGFTTNQTLSSAANKRAQEILQSFSHTRPNGTGFSTVLKEYKISYNTAGENIAYGQKTPQIVVNAWMNSPGHRANILNGKFKKIGIGVYQKNGQYYWTQEFTN